MDPAAATLSSSCRREGGGRTDLNLNLNLRPSTRDPHGCSSRFLRFIDDDDDDDDDACSIGRGSIN